MLKRTLIASAIGLLAGPLSANAAVIDFEAVTTPGGCDVNPGGSIGGFTLSPYDGTTGAGFNNATACDFLGPTAHSGSQYMVNYNSVYGQFTRDVGTFALNSLWVHADIRSGQTTVRFLGLDGPGGNVLYSRDVVVDPAWQQVVFTGWTGVKSLTWEPISPDVSNVQIDDLNYNAGPVAGSLVFNPQGVGHIQYVPYFSTQEGNVTAISIVNTDVKNGKVLKVRFRGASNSDDLYDFQLFLSPGDVWTAGIAQGADGRSRLDTTDKSCTLPANVNGAFVTSRISAAGGVAETREGYIEILTMADIVASGDGDQADLYKATKHVKGVAPCTSAVLTALTHENAANFMTVPTTGIMANWSIINVNKVVAYSGAAAAIEARDAAGEPGPGRLVYWDQRSIPLTVTEANTNTADPLLRGATPAIAGARYDLPDLSTPYVPDLPICPFCQARALSDAITAQEIAGEFFNEASLGAQTDWVISFPTRRYFAAVRYGTTNTIVRNATSDGNIYFTADNTELGSAANGGKAWQICSKLGVNAVAFYDREETPTIVDDIVISPGTPTSLSICGEVTVVGVNNASAANSATFGSVARSNVSNGFAAGWGSLTVPSSNGLPMLARQFLRINNTTTNVYYGMSFPARVVVPGFPPAFP